MSTRKPHRVCRHSLIFRLSLCLITGSVALLSWAGYLQADPDVYSVLPPDTRIVQYAVGDVDGDEREELAVLYTSGPTADIALFKAVSGRWSLWWEAEALMPGMANATPSLVELVDVNRDGASEILLYYLAGGKSVMTARIISLDAADPANPAAKILLEDTTAPPGYPLFGSMNSLPSVTFLKMPLRKGDTGHRRVYCWDGERFFKCVEVPWIKP